MTERDQKSETDRRTALEAEIEARIGHVPTFFRLGASVEVSEALWHQARTAYLDSPIPAGFQEPLFAYLSRFCEIPYCMVHHVGLLLGGGGPVPGSGTNGRYDVAQALRLLRRPVANASELDSHFKTLAQHAVPLEAWPEDLDSPLGDALFACAVHVFLHEGSHTRCVSALRRTLGQLKFERLVALLNFVRSAHAWTEAHDGPQIEQDVAAMLRDQPMLRLWAEEYRAVTERELGSTALHDMAEAHRELRDAAERLGAILEDSLNEIYVFDAESLRFTLVNRGARENLGYSMAELRDITPVDLKPDFTDADFRRLLAPLQTGGEARLQFTARNRRKNGSLYPVEVHVQLTPRGDAFVAIILDLTTIRQKDAEVAHIGAQARAILNAVGDAIISIDVSGTIASANAATTKLFGYEENELVGQNVRILMPSPHSEAHDDYLERYVRTGEARIIGTGRELDARHKDGAIFPIRLAVSEVSVAEERLFTGIIHDLSETRRLHQAQLLQAQKMEAIGTLAGGIAHDFNNLLTSIRGSSEMLVDHLERGGRLARSALRIRKAADRAAALTSRLLAFSRKQITQRHPLDLNRAVEEAYELVAHMLSEDIEFKTDLCRDAPYVHADAAQMSQALINLVVNGADAVAPGGSIVVATTHDAVTAGRAKALGLPAGDYVELRVTDTGAGIPPEALGQIFDPFFTTKEEGKGTGLGLSTVFGIVQDHGGTISVDSKVGLGTTFSILLPALETPEARPFAPSASTAKTPDRALGDTILLVEDDEILRDLISEVLEAEGYIVKPAADPAEALRHLHASDGEIALVITDVVMPMMSGFLLAKEVRSERPQTGVLYMSGYADQVLANRGELQEDDLFIRKPFGNDALLEKVREALANRDAVL